jgi:hypothetical protein
MAWGLAVAAALAAAPSAGFELADGSKATCTARGKSVREYAAPADDPIMRDRTGLTLPDRNGYVIAWNEAKLAKLPPVVRDFLFFHECAHARVPTTVELTANCEGLKAMRDAGRAGAKVEADLAAYFNANNAGAYWQQTVACADRPPNPPDPPGTLKVPRPPG